MKLMHVKTLKVEEFGDANIPPFAVFSYSCCENDGASSFQTSSAGRDPPRDVMPAEILKACTVSESRGIYYLWTPSVCINGSSPIDHGEAVNASFGWLEKSAACLVYLHDLPSNGPQLDESIWKRCKYWTYPWTIQDLIAPPCIEFFDQDWNQRGTKTCTELLQLLSSISGIPKAVLLDRRQLWETAMAMRISWAADRHANREEDVVYWLAPICGVTLSSQYGEGASRAFARLQKKILQETTDGSIFAWRSSSRQPVRGLLAHSPSEFRHFLTQNPGTHQVPWVFDGIIRSNNRGLEVQSRLFRKGPFILMEIGRRGNNADTCKRIGIWLRKWNDVYIRVDCASVVQVPGSGSLQNLILARDVDGKTSNMIMDELGMQSDFALEQQPALATNIAIHSIDYEARADLIRSPSPTSIRAGTKRDRLGNPKISSGQNGRPSRESPPYSGSSQGSSPSTVSGEDTPLSESDDGENSDGMRRYSDVEPLEDSRGAIHQMFRHIRPDLAKSCYNTFQGWLVAKHPHRSGTKELESRKRTKISERLPRLRSLKEENEHELDSDLFDYKTADGNLICPFYAHDPCSHHQCLIHCSLRSMDDVVHHLELAHGQPPYCPICRYTFETVLERDDHIYKRLCKPRFPFKVDGISYEQKMELMEQNDTNGSNEERWFQLFELLFPGSKPCRSATRTYDFEEAICLMREFWSSSGHDCILKFLRQHQLLEFDGNDRDQSLVALRILVLGDLTEKVIQDYSTITHQGF